MIHYKKEGHPLSIGLNVTVGTNKRWLPWITLIWCWYYPESYQLKMWRLRIRTWRFAIFTSKDVSCVEESYCRRFDLRLIRRELIEDLRLHAYINRDVALAALLDRYRLPTGD